MENHGLNTKPLTITEKNILVIAIIFLIMSIFIFGCVDVRIVH